MVLLSNGTAGTNTLPEWMESALTFILLDNLYSINERTSPSSSCHQGNYPVLLYSMMKCYFTKQIIRSLPADINAVLSFTIYISLSIFTAFSSQFSHLIVSYHSNTISPNNFYLSPSSCVCSDMERRGLDKGSKGYALWRNML